MEDLWPRVIDSLKERVVSRISTFGLNPFTLSLRKEKRWSLEVPNRFFKEWITEHYSLHIKDVVSLFTQMPCQLQFRIRNDKMNGKDLIAPLCRAMNSRSSILSTDLQSKIYVRPFCGGSEQQFAHAACLAVADLPAKNYNPLLFMGGGLGKTHLLHAIGYHILQHRILPDMRKICYLSSEEFTNELINSLRYEKMDEFRNKFRRMDILLIDDIQFIAGKERTQAEFFHTFNSLYEARKQIVVTSDKFSKRYPKL